MRVAVPEHERYLFEPARDTCVRSASSTNHNDRNTFLRPGRTIAFIAPGEDNRAVDTAFEEYEQFRLRAISFSVYPPRDTYSDRARRWLKIDRRMVAFTGTWERAAGSISSPMGL